MKQKLRYDAMLREAIAGLGEKNGSSVQRITRYIAYNYKVSSANTANVKLALRRATQAGRVSQRNGKFQLKMGAGRRGASKRRRRAGRPKRARRTARGRATRRRSKKRTTRRRRRVAKKTTKRSGRRSVRKARRPRRKQVTVSRKRWARKPVKKTRSKKQVRSRQCSSRGRSPRRAARVAKSSMKWFY